MLSFSSATARLLCRLRLSRRPGAFFSRDAIPRSPRRDSSSRATDGNAHKGKSCALLPPPRGFLTMPWLSSSSLPSGGDASPARLSAELPSIRPIYQRKVAIARRRCSTSVSASIHSSRWCRNAAKNARSPALRRGFSLCRSRCCVCCSFRSCRSHSALAACISRSAAFTAAGDGDLIPLVLFF